MRAFAAINEKPCRSLQECMHNTSPVATAALGRTSDSRGNHGKYDEK